MCKALKRHGSVYMARLWRSVAFLAICFAAVVAMRIYLNKQVELAKAGQAMSGGAVESPGAQ